jgi:hypothetical protein
MKQNKRINWTKKKEDVISKLPTILDILNEISYTEERWALEDSSLRHLFPYHIHEGLFEAVLMPDGKTYLVPMALSVNNYYRGESEYHPKCKPSLYRTGMTEEKIFLERLKVCELELLINDHPLSNIYKNGICITFPDKTTRQLELSIDPLALAQHYGIKTELLDFTSDKWVAAFFATTKYDYKTDSYSPILETNKYGVFYHYFNIQNIEWNSKFRPIGLQPFSRPGEQSGFGLLQYPKENLNNCCKKIKFRHNPEASELIFNYTNRGNRLFPYDLFAAKVEIIKESKSFSKEAYNLTKKKYYLDVDESILGKYINSLNIKILNCIQISFTQLEKNIFIKKWEQGNKEKFFNRIYVRNTYIA